MKTEILIVCADEAEQAFDVEGDRTPLGSQDEVRAALRDVFGEGTWHRPDEGVFDGSGFSVIAKLGDFPEVDSLTLEVWGKDQADPVPDIRQLCMPRRWQAFDLESGRTITELSEI